MAVKRSGNKPQNTVKMIHRDLGLASFMKTGSRPTPRYYDKDSTLADGTTSHNGVVKTTAGNR
jgi:hypothetical protein